MRSGQLSPGSAETYLLEILYSPVLSTPGAGAHASGPIGLASRAFRRRGQGWHSTGKYLLCGDESTGPE